MELMVILYGNVVCPHCKRNNVMNENCDWRLSNYPDKEYSNENSPYLYLMCMWCNKLLLKAKVRFNWIYENKRRIEE